MVICGVPVRDNFHRKLMHDIQIACVSNLSAVNTGTSEAVCYVSCDQTSVLKIACLDSTGGTLQPREGGGHVSASG